uniref:Kinesin motor domain-containing protein n=1 Tax=Parascaris univalens TaxID=6257 RepID=A0A915AVU8_PARUN
MSVLDGAADDSTAVRVALRIRPQGAREKLELCRICTAVTPGEPQVTIGGDRSFTYDFVFDQPTPQNTVYEKCVESLVDGTFAGFNATVLAYGQTGSGKTYTMGTAFDLTSSISEDEIGIIPRAMQHLFTSIEARKRDAKEHGLIEPIFDVAVQFIELYNEDIVDLLADDRSTSGGLRIHETANGEIFLNGVTSQPVSSPQETLAVLKNGALNRTTASTNMNEQSSRSHAIFTMMIKQQRVVVIDKPPCDSQEEEPADVENTCAANAPSEFEILTAKFHFVDLAGSERLKRTGATGERAKEGISINCGLLALGNVISALGGASGKVTHVPYRDSKLTRLLQDSLGGNSRTLIIACVSPSDCDFVETLNTLKYANRAKNIKNKVVANQDKSSKMISDLRTRIAQLEAELADYKQGRITIGEDGVATFNDQYQENLLLHADVNQLRIRVKALQETSEVLRARNVQLMVEKEEALRHSAAFKRMAHENETNCEVDNHVSHEEDAVSETIRHYLDELENLRSALFESQATNEQLRRQMSRLKPASSGMHACTIGSMSIPSSYTSMTSAPNTPTIPLSNGLTSLLNATSNSPSAIIEEARADIERMKRSVMEGLGESTETVEDEGACVEASDQRTDGDGVATRDLMGSGADEPMSRRIRSESAPKESAFSRDDERESDSDYEDDMDAAETERFKLRDDLADLQAEISIKERLVMELERSERRLAEVRITYEKKLTELSLRISATEAERDRVLAEMASKNALKLDSEHVKKIREDYERKLNEMRAEFKKLQSVEREHRKMQARQAMEQQQLLKLRSELADMKKLKVELMQKIKEEAKKAKASELAHSKKVAGLEKETRKKDSLIKQLENKDRQREMFLKRTTEEISRLRQQNRQVNRLPKSGRGLELTHSGTNLSATNRAARQAMPRTAAARARLQMGPSSGMTPFSAKAAKNKWLTIEKNICRRITQRQTVQKMEEELERRVNERHALIEEIQHLEQRFISTKDLSERDLIGEQIDGCQDKMGYLQDQISELQNTIASVDNDNAKDSNESDSESFGNVETILEECGSVAEAKYLLQRLLAFSLEQGFIAAKAKADHKESEARIQQLEQEAKINESLLSQVIEDKDIVGDVTQVLEAAQKNRSKYDSPSVVENGATNEGDAFGMETASTKNSTTLADKSSNPSFNLGEKARRRTATTDELLYPIKASRSLEEIREASDANLEGERTRSNSPVSAEADTECDSRPDSTCPPSTSHGHRNKSASDLRQPYNGSRIYARNAVYRSTITGVSSTSKLLSLKKQSKANHSGWNRFPSTSSAYGVVTPKHDHYTEPQNAIPTKKIGRIIPYTARTATGQRDRTAASRLLVRSHTLDGHTRGVLSVSANDTTVITGSKDRLAKLWDLERGIERCTLGLHQNNVTCVRLIPNGHLALSVSMSTVRIWDVRTEKCVYVLHSSGLATEGDAVPPSPSRQNTVPVSETVINAAEPDPTGRLLFTTFCGDVRIWNLEKFAAIGRLTGAAHGPRSEVSCLAVIGDYIPRVFTGSRDHYVKMYNVEPLDQVVFEARVEFNPPHYDNVTAILPYGDALFTASKDTNIMRFSMHDMKRDHLELKAHDKWILDMCLLDAGRPILTTVCKGGAVKLWDFTNTRKLRLIEELNRAHDEAINSVAVTESSIVFTASNDTTVGLWHLSNEAR